MTTTTETKKFLASSGPGLLPVVALGGLLGYLLAGDVFLVPSHHLLLSFCLGLVWAYLFVQWVSLATEMFSLFTDPVPLSLELGRRDEVRDHLAKLNARQPFTLRARRLLEAWTTGWSPRQVAELALFQSRRARSPMAAGTTFVVLLVFVCYVLGGNLWLTWGALVVLAITILARLNLCDRIDSYLEANLLTRLSANVPPTAATAAELAEALGGSIKTAFQNYIPQPEKMALAIQAAVENASRTIAVDIEKLNRSLAENQSSLADRMTQAAKESSARMSEVEKVLANAAKEMASGAWVVTLKGALTEHAEQLQGASQALADQLAKIQELEKGILKILHVQEVIDSTIKTVAATEEFRETLSALRTHIQESDNLLREVAKPKTIRLVEEEGKFTQE